GLIQYTWGEHGELLKDKATSLRNRLGLRDAKRLVVMLVLLFYASGLFVVLSMRDNVLVKIAPVRTELYRIDDAGQIHNTFRMTAANRQSKDAELKLSLNGLPDARIELAQPLQLKAGQELQTQFEIVVPPGKLPRGVNHFEIVSQAMPGAETTAAKMTFITPTERNHP
ncbi:MAG TPA: FixG Ig-like domain-containing protein, partial [Blastocatellia bacterium]|nr:FixG Ig-like domain-containing protein [Blastocatellia bacterium]